MASATDDNREPLPPSSEAAASSASMADKDEPKDKIETMPDPPVEFPWVVTDPETGVEYTFHAIKMGRLRELIKSAARSVTGLKPSSPEYAAALNEWTFDHDQDIYDAFKVGVVADDLEPHSAIWWANRAFDAYQMRTVFPEQRELLLKAYQSRKAGAVAEGDTKKGPRKKAPSSPASTS